MELLIKIINLGIVVGFLLVGGSYIYADLEDISESRIQEEEPYLIQEQNKIKKQTGSVEDKNSFKEGRKTDSKQESASQFQTERVSKKNLEKKGGPKKNQKSGKSKLKWEALMLKADRNNRLIELKQKVKLTQGDLLINSDEAVIFLDADSQVVRAEASGNVFISKGSGKQQLSAKSGKAVFYVNKRKILLTQNPIVWKEIDVIRGSSITYDVDSGMVTVSKVEGILESKMQEEE